MYKQAKRLAAPQKPPKEPKPPPAPKDPAEPKPKRERPAKKAKKTAEGTATSPCILVHALPLSGRACVSLRK